MKPRLIIAAAVATLASTASLSFGQCICWSAPQYAGGMHVIPAIKNGPTGIYGIICCERRYSSFWSYGMSCDWTIQYQNLAPVFDNTSTVAAAAGASSLQGKLVHGDAACDFSFTTGPVDVDLNADADTDYYASVDVIASSSVDLAYGNARAIARSDPNFGTSSIGTAGSARWGEWWGNGGYGSYHGLGIGGADTDIVATHEYDIVNPALPTSITLCMCIRTEGGATFSTDLPNHPECDGGSPGWTSSYGFTAFQVATEAEFMNGSTSGTSAKKGVIAFLEDGTYRALGSVDGANLPDGDAGDDLDRSGQIQVNIPSPIANPTSLRIHISHGALEEFDGDLDRDGDVDCHDRDIFLSLIGKDIDVDSEYDFRADFDLDGVIEDEDYRAFLEVLLESDDYEMADFNCDGICNDDDFYDYLDAWFGNDISAEVNTDGVLDNLDASVFVDAYLAGC